MHRLSADISLRPTRIGFLVNPTDVARIRDVMRHCACLWGGRYNPIIPASARSPEPWRPTGNWSWRPKGWELARRYIQFFEPDLFIDATKDAISKLNLPTSRSRFGHLGTAIPWHEFVRDDDSPWTAFSVGQDVLDLYRHLYRTQYQFVHREPPPIISLADNLADEPFFDAVFGRFPASSSLEYIRRAYHDAFQPTQHEPSVATFLKFWRNGAGPLWFTAGGLEEDHAGANEPVIFVFDPTKGTDLIDFWNLRLFVRDVVPVNVHWISECESLIKNEIQDNFRPMRKNPQGLMHRTVVEFASSINEEAAKALVEQHLQDLPSESFSFKTFYTSIWDQSKEDWYVKPTPISVAAAVRETELVIDGNSDYVAAECLTPTFADRFGGNARWVNLYRIRPTIGEHENRALCSPTEAPSDVFIRSFDTKASREGIVALDKFKRDRMLLLVQDGPTRIREWLKGKEVQAQTSDAGRLTTQVIDAIGGINGVGLLAHEETLHELNRMAAGHRVRSDKVRGTSEEETPPKSSKHATWVKIMKSRGEKRWVSASIERLTEHRVMQTGLVLRCTHCQAAGWFSLSDLSYELRCSRCLQMFGFPQAQGRHDWYFRAIGPFAVADYAGGSYATALTLRLLAGAGRFPSSGDRHFVYSTGLDLNLAGQRREIDLVAWRQDLNTLGRDYETAVIFGEAKSFASEAIKAKDCALLKELGGRFPGAFLVASVMKSTLSANERRLLTTLANWGRVPGSDGMPRSPVIILTGAELFADGSLEEAWTSLGGVYERALKTYMGQFNLWKLADCTQQIYLGMLPYSAWRRQRFETRVKHREGRGKA